MNKLFTKIAALALGATMAVGVGVAVGSTSKNAEQVNAGLNSTPVWSSGTPAYGSGYASGSHTLNGISWFVSNAGNNTCLGWNKSSQNHNDASSAPLSTISESTKIGTYQSSGGWNVGKIVVSVTNSDSVSGTWYIWYSTNSGSTWTQATTGTFSSSTTSFTYDHGSNISNSTRFAFGYGCSKTTGTRVSISNIQVYAYEDKALSSISVTDISGKTWHAGDTVVASDLKIVASYSNGDSATITDGTGVTITSGATLSEGTNTVVVSYTDSYGTASSSISITAAAAISLSSIAITTAPTKTTYNEGEMFSSAGMVVTATYSDSSTANVTSSCTYSPNGALATTDNEITVSYTYKDVTKTATQAITVNAITEVTFTAGTDLGTSTGNNSPDSMTKSGFTVYGSDAAFAAVSSGTYTYRVYASSELTFSVSSGEIGKITIVKNGSYALSLLTLKEGESGTWNNTTGIWTGKASSVTFEASAQFRANSFTIEKASTIPTLTLDKNSLELKTNESAGKQVQATVVNVENPSIVWTPNNNNVTIEAGLIVDGIQTVTIKPNVNVDANSTITVTVTGTTLSATISISISIPGPGETPETAYSVAEAIESIDEKGEQANVYVTGIISQIDTYYSNYHSITYWISDDGTTTSQFEVYSGKGLNGADFSSVDDLVIGSEVIVFGTIKLYNTTYEFGSSSSIYSIVVPPQVNSITLTPSIVEVAPEAAGDIVDLFTSIVINQDQGSTKTVNDIVWSTGDENVFYVDGGEYLVAGEHKDSTTLYASIDGKVYGSATIEVVDPDHPFITYDEPIEWTIVTDASTLKDGDQIVITDEDSTVGMLAYSSGNNCKDTSATGEKAISVSGTKMTDTGSSGILTLSTASSTDGTFYLYDGAHYLYAASNSGNQLKGKNSTDSSNGAFKFSYSSTMTIYAYGSSNRNYICYNSGNSLFSCYASGSVSDYKGLQVYKKSGGDAGTIDLDNTILTLVQSKMSNYQDEHGETQYGLSICNYNGGSDLSGWSTTVANGFTDSIISTYKLAYARSNRTGNDVEKFLSAYDYVVENYGASYDFLGRIASGKIVPSGGRVNPINTIISGESTTAVTIVVIVSLVSLTAIGGYFFIKRRKEN